MCQFRFLTLIFACSAVALPTKYEKTNYKGFEVNRLTDLVAAETAAVHKHEKSPKNLAGQTEEGGYYKTYGSNANGENGYEEGTFSHGQSGYKEYDTTHKQIGDSYGFDEQIEFGKQKNEDEGDYHSERGHAEVDADGAGTSGGLRQYYGGGGSFGGGESFGSFGDYFGGGAGGGDYYYGGGDGDSYNEEFSSGGENGYSNSHSYSSRSGRKSSSERHY